VYDRITVVRATAEARRGRRGAGQQRTKGEGNGGLWPGLALVCCDFVNPLCLSMLRYPVLFIKKEGGWAGSGHLAPVRSAQQIKGGTTIHFME
jgi:hypothetical protein